MNSLKKKNMVPFCSPNWLLCIRMCSKRIRASNNYRIPIIFFRVQTFWLRHSFESRCNIYLLLQMKRIARYFRFFFVCSFSTFQHFLFWAHPITIRPKENDPFERKINDRGGGGGRGGKSEIIKEESLVFPFIHRKFNCSNNGWMGTTTTRSEGTSIATTNEINKLCELQASIQYGMWIHPNIVLMHFRSSSLIWNYSRFFFTADFKKFPLAIELNWLHNDWMWFLSSFLILTMRKVSMKINIALLILGAGRR